MKPWLFSVCLLLAIAGCGNDHDHAKKDHPTGNVITKGKLLIDDVKVGTGDGARNGDTLYIVYTGTLTDGTQFDSNDKQIIDPFSCKLGDHRVIKGWEEGLQGMKVGGERKLTIPYEKAYGEPGNPPTIPPKSELIFKVRLLDILKKGDEMAVERTYIKEGTGPVAQKGSKVTVAFTGTIPGGKEFEKVEESKPFTFTLGKEEVVAGFDAGLQGMKQGSEANLRVGPLAGYGMRGLMPLIPANCPLNFHVKLLKVQ